MNRVRRLMRAADRIQQERSWLGLPIGVWKKFGDDGAGNLAALISYFAFVSIFPLLLVLFTGLDLVLRNYPHVRKQLTDSTLAHFPLIGDQLGSNVHPLNGTGLALGIGIAAALLAALGVANAMQNALNTVWEVPFTRRPGFPWSMLRSLGLIVVIGLGGIITVTLSGLAGSGHVLPGPAAAAGAIAVSFVLNVGVFWLAFRLATAREVAARQLLLGAAIAAACWQILLYFGTYLVGHQLKTTSAYGTFGLVLGLLAWFFLQAQLTLYAAEINVVRVRRLWPRSLFPPPLTEPDVRAYQLQAAAQQRRKELLVELRPAPDADPPAPPAPAATAGTDRAGGADGAGRPRSPRTRRGEHRRT